MVSNIYIFTDIDGVLQINNPKKWNKHCCKLYNDICNKYNLKPIITSTWRVRYNLKQLQDIFYTQNINVKLHDTTEVLGIDRGEEIAMYLSENSIDKYIVLDDNVNDMYEFLPASNIVKVEKSYIGLTEENIKQIEKIIKNVHT
jgi:hypothetical protein